MNTTPVTLSLVLLLTVAQSCSNRPDTSPPIPAITVETTATSIPLPSLSVSPSPEPPVWLSTFVASQTEVATTATPPSRDTLFSVEERLTAVIHRSDHRDPSLQGSLVLRASWAPDYFYLLDLSTGLAYRLPGSNLLIPELQPSLASALVSPDSRSLAYTECLEGGHTRLHVVNALAEEILAPPLPGSASWAITAWLDNQRILATEADVRPGCYCDPLITFPQARLAVLDLRTQEARTLHPSVPLENEDGVVPSWDSCIPAPALRLSPSEKIVALLRHYPYTIAPPRPPATYLELWDIATGRMVYQIKTSIVFDQPTWLDEGKSLLVGHAPYVPYLASWGDCEARTWIIEDEHSTYPIAECTADLSVSPSGRFVATRLFSSDESACPEGTYGGREVAILDLTNTSAKTVAICDPHSGLYISDPLWSPDEEYLAFSYYTDSDPPGPPRELVILKLDDGSASAYAVGARLLGWMQSPVSE